MDMLPAIEYVAVDSLTTAEKASMNYDWYWCRENDNEIVSADLQAILSEISDVSLKGVSNLTINSDSMFIAYMNAGSTDNVRCNLLKSMLSSRGFVVQSYVNERGISFNIRWR